MSTETFDEWPVFLTTQDLATMLQLRSVMTVYEEPTRRGPVRRTTASTGSSFTGRASLELGGSLRFALDSEINSWPVEDQWLSSIPVLPSGSRTRRHPVSPTNSS